MTDEITEKLLEEYRAARHIEPRSAEWRQLEAGRRNPHFGELLAMELARLRANDKSSEKKGSQ